MREETEAMKASKNVSIVWNVLIAVLVILDNIINIPTIPTDINAPVTWKFLLLILTDICAILYYVLHFTRCYIRKKTAEQNADNA